MEQYLIDELIHKAECYAAMNNCRLAHSVYNEWTTTPSSTKKIIFRIYLMPGYKYIEEIVIKLYDNRTIEDALMYFVSAFDKIIKDYRLYKEAANAMESYGGLPADDYKAWPAKNPYKEALYKYTRNGGKRAMYTYSDILWVEKIEKVIFNDPATIVFWRDGSKTVVKAQTNETFDPEKGLAMAIAKKALGNEGNYYETFKKFLPKE